LFLLFWTSLNKKVGVNEPCYLVQEGLEGKERKREQEEDWENENETAHSPRLLAIITNGANSLSNALFRNEKHSISSI
jgi:hypothetical protein